MSPKSIWKKTLLLLSVSVNRRDAAIAFVQTGLLSQPSVAFTSPTSLAVADLDVSATPLGQLIKLDCDDSDCFKLQTPAEDVIPLEEGQRLICVGDVHGDVMKLKEFLEIGGVYDPCKPPSEQWIGGNTILVQCGDVLDRGFEELECFNLLTRLSQQAANNRGHVILLFGNHEALNCGGMFHYTEGDAEYEAFVGKTIDQQLQTEKWRMQYAGNQPARWATYEPGTGVLAAPLLANMKVAVKVGRTVCVHAGLTAKHLDDYGGITGMNQAAQNWMKQEATLPSNNLGEYESIGALVYDVQKRAQDGADRMPCVLGGGAGAESPVWMRDYSSPNDAVPNNPKAQQMIDAALFQLQADRMVMGHTVQRQINSALQGKAWRVDVGASKGVMNGTPEVLEVRKENGEEVVSVLTKQGEVPAADRQVGGPPGSFASAVSSMLQG